MSQVKCRCGTVLTIADPAFEIFNGRYQSMIVFNHALSSGKCAKCSFEFMGLIESFDIETMSFKVGMCPAPVEPDKPMIETVPAGFDIRKIFS